LVAALDAGRFIGGGFMTHKLAIELNETLRREAPYVLGMLSELGRDLYFPKGILTQTAEAKQKANRCNATIGIAKESGQAMHLGSVMRQFANVTPDEVFPYAPSPGRPDLRAKWKELLAEKNPSLKDKKISLPVVTSGITHGLSIVADMFVERGDLMLVPEMYWGNYNMIFDVRRGATMTPYPFLAQDGKGLDTEGFRQTILKHAKEGSGESTGDQVAGRKLVVLLNFPHNPTGYSASEAEAKAICETLEEAANGDCDIVVVCDDAYFGLFYEPQVLKESIFARLAGRRETILCIKLDGATKEDYVWGLRVGFITFGLQTPGPGTYEALEKKAAGLIRGTISNCPHHSQSIVLKAMSDDTYAREREEKFNLMKGRAAKVKEVLADEKFDAAWEPYPFNSGYFMCLKMKDLDAEAFRIRLLDQYGIGVIAAGASDVRVAFSCLEEDEIAPLFEAMFQCSQEMKAATVE
jgi:aspartate/methionine/tyrosine aminotransferase